VKEKERPYLEGVRIKKFVYAVPFCLISDARYNEVLGLRFVMRRARKMFLVECWWAIDNCSVWYDWAQCTIPFLCFAPGD
jgi:hypothetical protein